jgi:peptidoglycan/LPS O-acetylase OafA/YrhL
MPAVQPKPERFVYLDGVRGLASLMVAVCHYVTGFQPAMLNGNITQSHFQGDAALAHTAWVFFYNPEFDVAIFFVLSGFVLAASVDGLNTPWLGLALRRWARLCLPVSAVAVIIYALQRLGAFHEVQLAVPLTKSDWLAAMFTPATYTLALFQILRSTTFGVFSADLSYGIAELVNGVLWTMPVEMYGSLGLFALYCFGADLFVNLRGRGFIVVFAILLTFNTPFYGFGFGIAFYEARKLVLELSVVWRMRLRRIAVPLGLILLLFGCWFGSTPYLLDDSSIYHAVIMFCYRQFSVVLGITAMHHIGAASFVAAVLLLPAAQRLLSAAPFRFLGRISFMLYLLQIPVLCFVGVHVFMRGWNGNDYEQHALRAFFVYLVVAIIAAELATRFLDRPATLLSRRLSTAPFAFAGLYASLRSRFAF